MQVVASAPTRADLSPPPHFGWPRVPGGVFIAADQQGQRWLCGGLLPCGACVACQAANHLACSDPLRPGSSPEAPGALATHLPLHHRGHPEILADLAPLPASWEERSAEVVTLLAAAGPVYQAAAGAGMVPGDTVFVFGDPGPGALPLRLLTSLGLSPLWFGHPDHQAGSAFLHAGGVEELPEMPSPRSHVIDLAPCERSLKQWLRLLQRCLTVTLVCPTLPRLEPPLGRLLAGQAPLRWVRELHPHLVLDVAALAASDELEISPWMETVTLQQMPGAFTRAAQGQSRRWPVVRACPKK